MKTLEEVIYELIKVEQYANGESADLIEEDDLEKYSWMQDNIETFRTAIELVKQLATGAEELEQDVLLNELDKTYDTYYKGGF